MKIPEIPIWASEIAQGNRVLLSRAITLIESQNEAHKADAFALQQALQPYTSSKSIRLGITGIPGAGKSTFIETFGLLLLEKGYKVAVLAIDPSSERTGGSILGDKIRMAQLAGSENVFIRPSPSKGVLGGVAQQTRAVIQLCEAAQFDFILIETVGVGQSEAEVGHLCDIFILLLLAGAGDEIQGIKRGIMEWADFLLVNKADGENEKIVEKTASLMQKALHFYHVPADKQMPQVLKVSALTGLGVEAVFDKILAYQEIAKKQGFWQEKRKKQDLFWFNKMLHQQWQSQLYKQFGTEISQAEAQILSGKDIFQALSQVLKQFPSKKP